ncbi:MAG: hypothetical protein ACE5HL_00260 [Terriglobia bacterium]
MTLATLFLSVAPAAAEEFYLKDSTKLVGKIVGYENGAFRVETSFGFAIIYQDRIARILFVTSPAEKPATRGPSRGVPEKVPPASAQKPAKRAAKKPGKLATEKAQPEPAKKETAAKATPEKAPPASGKKSAKLVTERPKPKPARRETLARRKEARRPALPAALARPEKIIEHLTGTQYVNESYRFQMFKPPTWRSYPQLIKPESPLVAVLGTPDETTLLLIGRETYKGKLADYIRQSERNLQRLYENYRRDQDRPTRVAGLPAVERSFTGSAEGRFWSGLAVYFARGGQQYTLLGLTAAGETRSFQQAILRKVFRTLEFLPGQPPP